MSGSSQRGARVERLVGIALAVALLGVVNAISVRHYRRFDATESDSFTLSQRTRAVLRGLDRDVTIHLLVAEEDALYGDLDELLRSYQAESRRLRVERLDPSRDPGRYRVLAARLGLLGEGGEAAGVDLVFESGDRRWNVRREDLLELAESTGESVPMLDVGAERALTGGLLEVVRGQKTKVCVTSGHGEYAVTADAERSLDGLATELARDNVMFEGWSFDGRSDVPEACHALFVLGPRRPFARDEATRLEAYLGRGGRVLLALDPEFTDDGVVAPTGLEALLEQRGMRLEPDLVLELDPAHLPTGEPLDPFFADAYGEHPMMRPVRGLEARLAFHLARSIDVTEAAESLVRTTASAYAERSVASLSTAPPAPSEGDRRGPLTLAAVYPSSVLDSGETRRPGRLVVVGDADLFQSPLLADPELGNGAFAGIVVGHLTSRPALVSIPPRRVRAQALVLPAEGARAIGLRVVVLLPLAFALLGLSVRASRRA